MHVEQINDNPINVRVTWEPPLETHGQIKSYRLMWGKRDGEDSEFKTVSISSTRFSYVADSMGKDSH